MSPKAKTQTKPKQPRQAPADSGDHFVPKPEYKKPYGVAVMLFEQRLAELESASQPNPDTDKLAKRVMKTVVTEGHDTAEFLASLSRVIEKMQEVG